MLNSQQLYEFIYLRPNVKFDGILDYFKVFHSASKESIQDLLTELQVCGKIYKTDNGSYRILPKNSKERVVKKDKRKRYKH